KHAEDIYQALGNVEGRAEVHYQRGLLLVNRKMIPEARAELQQARELARASQNQTQEVLTMLQLGSVAIAEGKNAEAQQLAADAVELAKRNSMTSLAVNGLIDVGNALYTHENLTDAPKYFEQALNDAD